MQTRDLHIVHKVLLAFGLNAFFYGVLMYVNLPLESRTWSAIAGELFPILFSEYFIGSLAMLGWLFIAEWVHKGFERFFGEEILSKGGVWPNLMALAVCTLLVFFIHWGAVKIIFWSQTLLLDQPDMTIVAQSDYAYASLRFGQVIYIFMAMLVYYLLTLRRVTQRFNEASVRAEQAQKKQLEAEYDQLRHRVNPHFLFNSLSTLSSLVHVDAEQSEQFVEQLSKAYRYLLETRDREMVSLQAELDFIQTFGFLQKTRFGDKLHLETDITPEQASLYQLLPLTLQTLVERAMRHNRMSAKSPLTVRIFVKNNELHVENNRQARSEPDPNMGSYDWETLEKRYAQWADPEVFSFDHVSDTSWLTKVPLRRVESASPQPFVSL
jgi:two-component system, LytTR family, sensor kinase